MLDLLLERHTGMFSFRIFEEKEDGQKGDTAKRQIDPEAPPPACPISQYST